MNPTTSPLYRRFSAAVVEISRFLTAKRRLRLLAPVLALGLVGLNASSASAVTVPSPGCMSASAVFHSVDNSGAHRSFTMHGSLSKWCGTYAALKYKMNLGSASTGWKTGISKYTNGTESGYFSDSFYFPNVARGAWVELCGYWSCHYSTYIDNPYN